MKKKKDSFSEKNIIDTATIIHEQETINRYGSAAKEHLIAYSGVDNETGQIYKRGLKDVANSKINPKYASQNYKQQAGFSAEIKETARENAERIIKGDRNRVTRTDDIGRVNDPLFDHVEQDADGNIIKDSGTQMKFVGKNPSDCLNKLMSEKYQKYRDNNVPFEVPFDFYDDIQQEIDVKINKLEQQKLRAKNNGNSRLATEQQNKIDELKKVKKNMKKSHVSTKEAMEARKSPKLSTAKDIHNISHRAGMEGLKSGAQIGATISTITNLAAVIRGKKDVSEAVVDIGKTTALSAGTGYVATYGSTALKAFMQNSTSTVIRNLSATGIPGAIVNTAISSVKSFGAFINGDIDAIEFLERVGKNAVATATSMAYGAVGQMLIPIPVAGAIVGSLVGYTLTTMIYGGLIESMQRAKIARERRILIEKECKEAIKQIRAYRQEMSKYMDSYISDYATAFNNAFSTIKSSLNIGDVDGFIDSVNQITHKLGGKTQFSNMNEFNALMKSDKPFVL